MRYKQIGGLYFDYVIQKQQTKKKRWRGEYETRTGKINDHKTNEKNTKNVWVKIKSNHAQEPQKRKTK